MITCKNCKEPFKPVNSQQVFCRTIRTGKTTCKEAYFIKLRAEKRRAKRGLVK
jgi:hypothetical protein